jgi:hypothetical protein
MKLEGLPTEERIRFMKRIETMKSRFEKKTAPQAPAIVSEEPSSPKIQLEPPKHTAREASETPQGLADQPSATTRADEYVQLMIRYAMNERVTDSEAKILGVKRDLEALNLKNQVIQRQRKKAREANDRGLQHLRRWEVPEAVQAFRTAVEADPADIEAINNLGHAYLWQDDPHVRRCGYSARSPWHRDGHMPGQTSATSMPHKGM